MAVTWSDTLDTSVNPEDAMQARPVGSGYRAVNFLGNFKRVSSGSEDPTGPGSTPTPSPEAGSGAPPLEGIGTSPMDRIGITAAGLGAAALAGPAISAGAKLLQSGADAAKPDIPSTDDLLNASSGGPGQAGVTIGDASGAVGADAGEPAYDAFASSPYEGIEQSGNAAAVDAAMNQGSILDNVPTGVWNAAGGIAGSLAGGAIAGAINPNKAGTWEGVGGAAGSIAGGAAGGALMGQTIGWAAGPIGAAIGAMIGVIASSFFGPGKPNPYASVDMRPNASGSFDYVDGEAGDGIHGEAIGSLMNWGQNALSSAMGSLGLTWSPTVLQGQHQLHHASDDYGASRFGSPIRVGMYHDAPSNRDLFYMSLPSGQMVQGDVKNPQPMLAEYVQKLVAGGWAVPTSDAATQAYSSAYNPLQQAEQAPIDARRNGLIQQAQQQGATDVKDWAGYQRWRQAMDAATMQSMNEQVAMTGGGGGAARGGLIRTTPQGGAIAMRGYAMGGMTDPMEPDADDGIPGGAIDAPGGDTDDAGQIRVSNGEFVIPAAVVRYFGQKFFDNLVAKAEQKGAVSPGNADGDVGGNMAGPAQGDRQTPVSPDTNPDAAPYAMARGGLVRHAAAQRVPSTARMMRTHGAGIRGAMQSGAPMPRIQAQPLPVAGGGPPAAPPPPGMTMMGSSPQGGAPPPAMPPPQPPPQQPQQPGFAAGGITGRVPRFGPSRTQAGFGGGAPGGMARGGGIVPAAATVPPPRAPAPAPQTDRIALAAAPAPAAPKVATTPVTPGPRAPSLPTNPRQRIARAPGAGRSVLSRIGTGV